jgi:hypothetical protein
MEWFSNNLDLFFTLRRGQYKLHVSTQFLIFWTKEREKKYEWTQSKRVVWKIIIFDFGIQPEIY